MIKIAVINESTVIPDSDMPDVLEALQHQVDLDFAPIWGQAIDTELVLGDKTQPTPPGVWELVILDNSDQAGALGYHDVTSNGDPLGKIFAKDDQQDGTSWTVTASHELLEMLGDPEINLTAEADASDGTTKFYAYEACDACEDDSFGYKITTQSGKDILVSDFVTPKFFMPSMTAPGTQYDFKGNIKAPLQILTNGYLSVWSPATGWSQITGELVNKTAEQAAPKEGHRRYRRTTKASWQRSKTRG
jgi:hypothetical protein